MHSGLLKSVDKPALSVVDVAFALSLIGTMCFSDIEGVSLVLQILFCACSIIWMDVKRAKLPLYTVWFLAFSLFAFSSCIWSVDSSTFLSMELSLVKTLLYCSCVVVYVASRDRLDFFVSCLLLSFAILSIRTIVLTPVSSWGVVRAGSESGYGYISLARVLACGAILSLFCSMSHYRKKRILWLLLFALCLFVVIISGTRKGLIAILVGGVLVLVFRGSHKSITSRVLALAVVIVIACAVAYALMNIDFLYKAIGYRLESLFSYALGGSGDKSLATRSTLYQMAIESFQNNPIFGIGLDAFKYVNPIGMYAHSNVLEILADLGIVGFALYYWYPFLLVCKVVKGMFSESGSEKMLLAFAMLVAMLFMDITDVCYFRDFTHIYYCLVSLIVLYPSCGFGVERIEE